MGPDGLAVLDKPAGWTSHDVVARCRRVLGTRRVGHAGTLDPMATGILVVGVGRGTKLLTYLVGADKGYRATIRLGVATTTDDADGEVTGATDAGGVTDAAITAGVERLTGAIDQVPSTVSAIKIHGKPAYARVRAGEAVALAARRVTVRAFTVEAVHRGAGPGARAIDVEVTVDCSSGTYVRALARDLGAGLGVGGHLTVLRRTRVGPFRLDAAVPLPAFEADPALLSLTEAARAVLPVRDVTATESEALRHGRRIRSAGGTAVPTAAIGPDGDLVAVVVETGPVCRPVLVLGG
jgi:tRNA pseudouridine55 synthase